MAYIRSRSAAPVPERSVVFPNWVMLDRDGRTICHDDDATAPVKNESTAVQVHTTSGHSGFFSFNLVDPPKVSYLDLHWKSVFPPAYPSVLASDENLVLLRIAIPSQPNYSKTPSDLFVYEAGASPSLLRLPVYTTSARGLAGRDTFLVDDLAIGILRRSDHYLVADLIVSEAASSNGDNSNYPMMAKLCVYYSKKKKWQVSSQTAPPPRDQSNRGKHYSDEVCVSKCYANRFRSVSISQGMMRFVHIDNDWHETVKDDDWDEFHHDSYKGLRSGSKITIWTLNADFNWEEYRVINLDNVWKQPSFKNLGISPRLPEFPTISMDDPDVLYCLLREEEFGGRAWMIMVDMKDSKLSSCTRYVNENISYIQDMYLEDRRNSFSNVPLHATAFSEYLKRGQQGYQAMPTSLQPSIKKGASFQ